MYIYAEMVVQLRRSKKFIKFPCSEVGTSWNFKRLKYMMKYCIIRVQVLVMAKSCPSKGYIFLAFTWGHISVLNDVRVQVKWVSPNKLIFGRH